MVLGRGFVVENCRTGSRKRTTLRKNGAVLRLVYDFSFGTFIWGIRRVKPATSTVSSVRQQPDYHYTTPVDYKISKTCI